MKIPNKYIKMSEIYKIFSLSWKEILNFDEHSLIQMYLYESRGIPFDDKNHNGFYIGKQYMDVQISMWKLDIECGNLTIDELLEDNSIPNWFINKVLTK